MVVFILKWNFGLEEEHICYFESLVWMINKMGSSDELKPVGNRQIVANQKVFAVKKLLKHEPVRHMLGPDGDYEVHTSIKVNHGIWRASCEVRRNGVEIEKFPPLYIDHNPQIRHQRENLATLQLKFVREAVAAHFDRCNAVKEFIISQNQSSCLWSNIKIIVLLLVSFLLLVLAGYLLIFTVIKSPSPKPDVIKLETFFYTCKPSESCYIPLHKGSHWHKASELKIEFIETDDFPNWLTFDSNRFYFIGQVPLDEPNQIYDFQIRMTDSNTNKRLLLVRLKIDGHTLLPQTSPTGKSFDSKNIDEGYLLEKLLDN
jgi:hypothetical protein